MSDRSPAQTFRVVNTQSGRVIDELRTEELAVARALRELGRVSDGRYEVQAQDGPGQGWRVIRDVGGLP